MVSVKDFNRFIADSTHKELNPKFWDKNKKLLPEVREALGNTAMSWAEFADIPMEAIEDVVLVGGNASYFYGKESDLDVHLVLDTDEISECTDLLKDYLRAKKRLWGLLHDVTVRGSEVELFGEDSKDKRPVSLGRYSLNTNKWIDEPTPDQLPDIDDIDIHNKVENWVEMIDDVIEEGVTSKEALDKLENKLKNMRMKSLTHNKSEFSEGNLVYKLLRNLGYVDKLAEYSRKVVDDELSLN